MAGEAVALSNVLAMTRDQPPLHAAGLLAVVGAWDDALAVLG